MGISVSRMAIVLWFQMVTAVISYTRSVSLATVMRANLSFSPYYDGSTSMSRDAFR